MNFGSIDEIKKAGFEGFKRMSELFDSSFIPDTGGVYLVLRASKTSPEFRSIGTGGHFKGKDPNVSQEKLSCNWVEKALVVYIGEGTSLKSRLRQYFRFGQRSNIGHRGGRFIWQLEDSNDLLVCWKTTPDTVPRDEEKRLISDFKRQHNGMRPFANLKD